MTTRRMASLLLSSLAAFAAAASEDDQRITDLDLATLMTMDVTVTSAARRAQTSSDVAAAVYVITRDDIRHSGASSIPELLRGVPGIQVARETNSRWAVSARGFSSRFANKLLVLIDGRSVYTQQFSGVFWEQQHLPLGEIERIEIVRGPGGALWGANAVNGIINIITRAANDGSKYRIAAGAGNRDAGAASMSFRGAFGESTAYRAYVEQLQRDSFEAGASPWKLRQGGWRLDGTRGDSSYTLQGDVLDSELGSPVIFGAPVSPVEDTGANLNFNWNGAVFAAGRFDLQSSCTWRQRDKFGLKAETESAFDMNVQYSAARKGRHLLTLGGGFRWLQDRFIGPEGFLNFDPRSSDRTQSSLYAQDEIFFFSDHVRLTAGAKIEDFEYTGVSVQPTLRALWHIDSQHTIWTAFSRAVRTPSRFERGSRILIFRSPGDPPVDFVVMGSPGLREERLEAKELGWRWRPSRDWSFDLALFENDYDELSVTTTQAPQLIFDPAPVILLEQRFANTGAGRSHGLEASIDWVVKRWLRFKANGTWFDMDAPGVTLVGVNLEGTDPQQSYALFARLDLPRNTELDLSWRRVSALPSVAVGAYSTVGLRLGWRPTRRLDLSLTADNLFDREHVEFVNEEENLFRGDELDRSFFLRMTWHSGR